VNSRPPFGRRQTQRNHFADLLQDTSRKLSKKAFQICFWVTDNILISPFGERIVKSTAAVWWTVWHINTCPGCPKMDPSQPQAHIPYGIRIGSMFADLMDALI